MHMLLEVDQRVLNSVFERFLELFIELFHEFEPLLLDLLLAREEELLINCEELGSDHFEVVLEGHLFDLELGLLGRHELRKFVQRSLLDLSQDRA